MDALTQAARPSQLTGCGFCCECCHSNHPPERPLPSRALGPNRLPSWALPCRRSPICDSSGDQGADCGCLSVHTGGRQGRAEPGCVHALPPAIPEPLPSTPRPSSHHKLLSLLKKMLFYLDFHVVTTLATEEEGMRRKGGRTCRTSPTPLPPPIQPPNPCIGLELPRDLNLRLQPVSELLIWKLSPRGGKKLYPRAARARVRQLPATPLLPPPLSNPPLRARAPLLPLWVQSPAERAPAYSSGQATPANGSGLLRWLSHRSAALIWGQAFCSRDASKGPGWRSQCLLQAVEQGATLTAPTGRTPTPTGKK